MQPAPSLNKFIVASILLHLGLFSFVVKNSSAPAPKNKRIEISFGSGNSRGGSGPLKATAPQAPKAVKTDRPAKAAAQVVAKTETTKTSDTASSVAVSSIGSGLGTGTGSGTGTTSGSGAGFNDPKIKYRGLIHQMVNEKKQYPRKARSLQQEGRVIAKLRLSKTGKLLKMEITQSSSYESLARATEEAIKSIDKFPDIPAEMGVEEVTLSIPFDYSISSSDFL